MTPHTRRSALALALLAMGCTRVSLRANEDHCTRNEGDQYCAELFPDLPYCIQGKDECSIGDRYGCVAEVAPECHAPCGVLGADECIAGESSSGTDTGTSAGETIEASSGSSGESSSTTGPMPCVSDEECTDAEAPFCGVMGECGTCDGASDPDAACAGVDPGLPLCVGGACVACTPENPAACAGTTPICDGATNTCVPCIAHEQCGEAACNLYTGACLPADRVFEVGGAMPDFPSLSMAVASLEADTESTLIVHPGMPDYNEAVVVDGGRVVAFLAAEIGVGVEPPGWIQSSAGVGPQLTVAADTTVLLDGLRLSGNADGLGLRVDGGQAWVDRSRIVQNSGGGVLAENGAELTLRNCFVGRNGDEFADTRGITATGSSLDVRYTTIAANDGSGGAITLSCDAASTGEVRNSIVAAGDDTIACANVSFSFSVVDTAGLTGSNNDVLSFAPAWFPNIAMSDFHIAAGPPFADVAQWQAGDPTIDIDGDLRPTIDGTLDYAGADVPQ